MQIEINGRKSTQIQAQEALSGTAFAATEKAIRRAQNNPEYVQALGPWKVENDRFTATWGSSLGRGMAKRNLSEAF